jgi:hypothetical protein
MAYPSILNPSATFTRPANTTQYASGDLVADNTTAGSVTPMSFAATNRNGGAFMIRRARLWKSDEADVTGASFRLHLYASSPTVTNGDNGAWLSTRSGYLGSIDFDMTGTGARTFSDDVGVVGTPTVGSEISVKLATGQTVYGLLEARGTYTPASGETFVVELECLIDP